MTPSTSRQQREEAQRQAFAAEMIKALTEPEEPKELRPAIRAILDKLVKQGLAK